MRRRVVGLDRRMGTLLSGACCRDQEVVLYGSRQIFRVSNALESSLSEEGKRLLQERLKIVPMKRSNTCDVRYSGGEK